MGSCQSQRLNRPLKEERGMREEEITKILAKSTRGYRVKLQILLSDLFEACDLRARNIHWTAGPGLVIFFSVRPVKSRLDKSGGLAFFNLIKIYLSHCMISLIKNMLRCCL